MLENRAALKKEILLLAVPMGNLLAIDLSVDGAGHNSQPHAPWGYPATLRSENEQILIYFNSNLESGRMYSHKTK